MLNPLKTLTILLALTFAMPAAATDSEKEKPIQHLKVADVTSMADAERIFRESTAELEAKEKLDATELQQIHIITYSLEKSVAYFAEHLDGDRQALAEKIAVVVEEIHIHSENNRPEQTRAALDTYSELAKSFSSEF